ncbi:MAG: DUF1924 domain-containing protein [gamma proteobacterium symbiont of Bathyaustriella thionipta]|nr:DUF1924 domain-containing protein [gamma proteobacterium symbiont of Bathyaustriella thionipta]MCU7950280.1 DUF1924 domain-containing protein [gamma proteobacterium symbiont of Bathyaustriella thionipta]MCU7951811.1 DUF1924 domain-containing protein [gamma proteobacterium symbiont of Bathyaustriella thionipta]MCU7957547.1 DUF1924 domain-containing protein [gamma proteobacterium symbiont of Bathyaustriella thionipta]MCU7966990.1 DUF1924 domain-containing protein [gamma proteobacterium symbion
MNRKFISITALLFMMPFYAQADAVSELEANYQTQGAGPFSSVSGEAMWNKTFIDAKTGKKRNCATCHTIDLTKKGKHARTGKAIEPMAPSVNLKRLTRTKKIKKWFVRNCKWTLGRECSAQEKGDFLAFIKNR